MNKLKYPIGSYDRAVSYKDFEIKKWIEEIKSLPDKLVEIVIPLTEKQLDTSYRPGGWTVRQLVHHIADSHMNSYIRMKWALTEQTTTIKAYDQEAWAKLGDYEAPVSVSLELIKSLHNRWGYFLDGLTKEDLEEEYIHPKSGRQKIWSHIHHYAWHSRHHLAHITSLVERKKWK